MLRCGTMTEMQLMMNFSRCDVVLVNFVFGDEAGIKRRPAVIISSDMFHAGRDEVVIAAITSCTDRVLPGDGIIDSWQDAGLLFPSVATGIIRTIKRGMITRRLGSLMSHDILAINRNMRLSLGLD